MNNMNKKCNVAFFFTVIKRNGENNEQENKEKLAKMVVGIKITMRNNS